LVGAGQASISFKGTVSTDAPALVELLYQTSAGTPGGGSTPAPKKHNQSNGETVQSATQTGPAAAATGWTTEPTAGDVIHSAEIHPQGRHTWIFPPGNELDVKGGGRLALRVTDGTTEHKCVAEFVYEE